MNIKHSTYNGKAVHTKSIRHKETYLPRRVMKTGIYGNGKSTSHYKRMMIVTENSFDILDAIANEI